MFIPQPLPDWKPKTVRITQEAFLGLPAYECTFPTMSLWSGDGVHVLGTEIWRRGIRVFRWYREPMGPMGPTWLVALSATVEFVQEGGYVP